jgi:hypothetical protein
MKTLLSCILIFSALAFAGTVYDRALVDVGNTGAATVQPVPAYSAARLTALNVLASGSATNDVLVSRVTVLDGTSYTQTVATVAVASGTGRTESLAIDHLAYGDTLAITSTLATNATVLIEYEVQRH